MVVIDCIEYAQGFTWLTVRIPVNGYEEWFALPGVIRYDGKCYSKFSWNSDTGKVYYTDHKKLAEKA